MRRGAQITEFKFDQATHTIVWMFDQSSCHKAYASDALIASKINVYPGGSQPLITTPNGVVKGLLYKLVRLIQYHVLCETHMKCYDV